MKMMMMIVKAGQNANLMMMMNMSQYEAEDGHDHAGEYDKNYDADQNLIRIMMLIKV